MHTPVLWQLLPLKGVMRTLLAHLNNLLPVTLLPLKGVMRTPW
ncbi:hypothetical protein [Streptomyces calidiresistens]